MTYSIDREVCQILESFYDEGIRYNAVIIFDDGGRLDLWRGGDKGFYGRLRIGKIGDMQYNVNLVFEVGSLSISYIEGTRYLTIHQMMDGGAFESMILEIKEGFT